MPRSLISRFFIVAKSGPTIDGREITKQEIIDIAETYNPATYTASIFADHERWSGSLGTVFEAKQEALDDGELGLYVKIKPNNFFLWLNEQGQKLFGSVEICPNFLGKGRAYLSGLGATDDPASTGTEAFYFSKKKKITPDTRLFSQSLEIPQHLFSTPHINPVLKALKSLGAALGLTKNHFKQLAEAEQAMSMTPEEQTAILTLVDQIEIGTKGIRDFIEASPADQAPQTQEQQDAVTQIEDATDTIVEEGKEQAEFKKLFSAQNKAFSDIANGLSAINSKLESLAATPTNRFNANTSGGVNDQPKQGKGQGAL